MNIEEIANKESENYESYIMQVDLDRDFQYSGFDYKNGYLSGFQKCQELNEPKWIELDTATLEQRQIMNNHDSDLIILKFDDGSIRMYNDTQPFALCIAYYLLPTPPSNG